MLTSRVLKASGLFAGGTGLTLWTLQKNKWDYGSLGVVRFGRAFVAVTQIVLDYKTTLYASDLPRNPVEYAAIKSQVHQRSAERLLNVFTTNKGIFIKFGQHLGALDYLLPHEYVNTLKILHKDAPESSLDEIYQVIREELNIEPTEYFTSFDDRPLGVASLAQVHKATLRDGTCLAVKVQHPKVKAFSSVDMKSMEFLVNMVSTIFPDFKFMWLARETKKNLPLELDFFHEAENAERVSRMFSHIPWFKIPKIYWDLTTSRVLTMEFCEGGGITDKKYMETHGIDPHEVTHKLGKLYSEMIFVQGYVHCDPHPGNILVHKHSSTGKLSIVLLDHGLYSMLTDEFRLQYGKLWMSLLNADVKGIRRFGEQMGVGDLYGVFACMVTGRSWDTISSGLDKNKITKQEEEEVRAYAGNYLHLISEVLNRVPRDMLLIFKTNDLLRGIESSLNTRASMSSFITMSRCCVRAFYQQKLRECNSVLQRSLYRFRQDWELFKICLYQFYMWVTTWTSLQRALYD